MKKKRAQSIVEYLLVFGGIVLAVLIGAKILADRTNEQMKTAGAVINKTSNVTDSKLGLSAEDYNGL